MDKQKNLYYKYNQQKGITLIALVITIIVLLILAGVTISTLSSNNSTPQKATEAVQKDAIATAKDEITMEAHEALLNHYNDVYVSNAATGIANTASKQEVVESAAVSALNNVKSKNNNILSSSKVSTKTHKITINTRSYTVTGTVETTGVITWDDLTNFTGNVDPEPIEVNTLRGMIGKTVNYTGYESSYNSGWRLFYADTDNAYLISTATIDSTTLFGGTTTLPLSDKDLTTVMSSDTYGGKWNAMWLERTDKVTSESRHKAITYLCDSSNWTSFVATNAPTGTYAVGAPTMELFLAAWNLRLDESNPVTPVTATTNRAGYYDTVSSGINTTVKAPNGSEELYNNGKRYWLASTDSTTYNFVEDYKYHVLGVSSDISYSLYYNNSNGIRPIVVIPRDKLKESANKTSLEVIMQTDE